MGSLIRATITSMKQLEHAMSGGIKWQQPEMGKSK